MAERSQADRPVVVASILEPDARGTEEALDGLAAGCGLVEIRADRLGRDDTAGLVRRAGRPVVVTVRRPEDGGSFRGSEDERRAILRAALDAGARYVDLEWRGPSHDLAVGAWADRVILSHHGAACRTADLLSIYRGMAATAAARWKIVAVADSPAQIGAVRETLERAAAEHPGRLACFAMGRAGAASRLFAPSWGSWATYGSVGAGRETASGQFPVDELLGIYDVLALGGATQRYMLVGSRVFGSPSPAMHAAAYRAVGLDARYFPVETDDLDDVLPLVGPDGVAAVGGLAVTMPFKERAAARCRLADEAARDARSVNTVVVRGAEWVGRNTDGPAVVDCIRRHLDPVGRQVVVLGAGGTGRAAAGALRRAGARVTLVNRGEERGRRAAADLGVPFVPLDGMAGVSWDVLVHATPLGSGGERAVPRSELRGELVVDAVYSPRPTPLVHDALARGLAVVDGFELLVAQALRQFELLTGRTCDRGVLERAGCDWLAANRA